MVRPRSAMQHLNYARMYLGSCIDKAWLGEDKRFTVKKKRKLERIAKELSELFNNGL